MAGGRAGALPRRAVPRRARHLARLAVRALRPRPGVDRLRQGREARSLATLEREVVAVDWLVAASEEKRRREGEAHDHGGVNGPEHRSTITPRATRVRRRLQSFQL